MNQTDPLAQLRDISLPPAPPEALSLPLLWLAIIVLGAIAGAAWLLLRPIGWRAELLSRLNRMDGRDDAEALAETAGLLRRAALLKLGPETRKLTGDDWLAALDRLFGTTFFTRGNGRVFGEALYGKAAATAPLKDLRRLVRRRVWRPW